MFEDKTLVCKDCGKEFVWTAGEQEYRISRALKTSPSAASPAVTPVKKYASVAATDGDDAEMFDAVCAACGKACKVLSAP